MSRLRVIAASPCFVLGLAMWVAALVLWITRPAGPSVTLAQAIPVAAAETNPYWAGYLYSGAPTYRGISATWVVPAIPCDVRRDHNATAYAWIGEGGYLRGLASPLIQAGTGVDCIDGVLRYHAFYEWYPGSYAQDFPIAINAGDRVHVVVRETAISLWELSVVDLTTGSRSLTSADYAPDSGSAELVVERPTVCNSAGCAQLDLAGFKQVIFSDVRVDAGTFSPGVASPIALDGGQSGRFLAVPARVPHDPDAASVLWRAAR